MSKAQLDRLAAARELNCECQVWQAGWRQAVWAAQLYPWLENIVPTLAEPDAHAVAPVVLATEANGDWAHKSPPWALLAYLCVTGGGAFLILVLGLVLQRPLEILLFGAMFFIAGMLMIGGALFDWKLYWSHRKTRNLRSLLGPRLARSFHAGFGAVALLCSFAVVLASPAANPGAPRSRTWQRLRPSASERRGPSGLRPSGSRNWEVSAPRSPLLHEFEVRADRL